MIVVPTQSVLGLIAAAMLAGGLPDLATTVENARTNLRSNLSLQQGLGNLQTNLDPGNAAANLQKNLGGGTS
jgi:hypothetical protein